MKFIKKLIKTGERFLTSDGYFIIFSALLYLFLAGVYLKTHAFIGTDGCNYAIGTENIARGKGFTRDGRPITLFMPLYSYAAVPFYLLFKNSETATRFVSLLSAILTLPLLYFLVKRLFNAGIARISTFLLATNTPFMKVSSDVLVEGLMLMLLISACYFYSRLMWNNENKKLWFLSLTLFSLFSALATLTRPDALFFYLVFLLFYLVIKSEKLVNKFPKLLISIFIFTLVLIPQLSFQYIHKGRIQITDKVQNHLLWGDLYAFKDKENYYKLSAFKVYDVLGLPLPADVQRPPDLTNFSAISFILQNPGKLIKRAYFNLLQGIGFLNEGMVFPL
ncbi:MAG: glycosyltransferase family 39 protein, partial [Candidatus Sumerlaeia bacterium]|nr:glycosyltransferase family 39 protein [Candidatus Sumerlaeia bacterium]